MRIKQTMLLAALGAALLLIAGCGGEKMPEPSTNPAELVQPDPKPPVAADEPGGVAPIPMVTPEPTPTVTPEPTPAAMSEPAPAETAESTPAAAPEPMLTVTPKPTPEPTSALRPGEYIGSDGSVLTVNADSTCTYETTVSGTINGQAMSGRLTFHGTVDDGKFSFTKVMYFGLDLTAIAQSAGYGDASYWETAAAIIYGG